MIKHFTVFFLLLSVGVFSQTVAERSLSSTAVVEENLAQLPLLFRQNMGQWDDRILFSGSSRSVSVSFLKNELSFGFVRPVVSEEEEEREGKESETVREAREIHERAFNPGKKPDLEYLVWNVRFEGANPGSAVAARGKADSKANYFIGNDPGKHGINVPDYKVIAYENMYDHIDLKYYGSNSRMKYDFVVHPKGDVNKIKMNYRGIKKIRIGKTGELILSTPWGKMREEKPFTYQLINGKRTEVASSYVLLNDSTVGFKMLQDYAKDLDLIIDPIVLDWATFVGGNVVAPAFPGSIAKIAMDAAGNVYAVGSYPALFPVTPGSYSNTFQGGSYDAFLFKINTTGTALVYSTYIGGNQWDTGTNLFLNAAGEVYITGQTSSFNWPTTAGAYDVSYNGTGDIFVTKFNVAGSALLLSTFIGGTGSDMGGDITLDATNNIYVAGNTSSANFPTTAGVYSTTLKGTSDVIACKLNPAGNTMLYSTLVGSSKTETGVGLGVNGAGEVTIGCNTDSSDFPTTAGAYDQTYNDGPNIYNLKGDMAIFKLNAAASTLMYSTFLGGNIGDVMQGMYLGPSDEAYVCGVILFSTNFPITPGVVDPTTGPGTFDSFATRLNATGSGLIYSTYLGNTDPSSDEARDIYVNSANEAYITGDGGSYATFPVVNACPCTTCKGGEDIYLCKLNPAASSYVWSTYLGSKDWDVCSAIAQNIVGGNEEVALGWGSSSLVFPTTPGVFQVNKPSFDSTMTQPGVAKFKFSSGSVNAGPDVTICSGASVTLSAVGAGSNYVWNPGGQSTSSITVSPSATTTYSLSAVGACGSGVDSVKVTVAASLTAGIGGNLSICAGQTATLTAAGGSAYSWSTGASTANISVTPTSSATYSVVVSSGSCAPDTATATVIVSTAPNASITGNSALCSGQSTTLTASGGGTYSWNTGSTATSLIISPTTSTTYTVTVNIGGCTATATQSVSVMPGITLALTATQTGCTVNNGTATANASSGTPGYTYSWSNGQITQTATGLAAGNYTATITDAAGCTKTQTVSVTSTSNLGATATSTQTGCNAPNGTASATGSAGTAPYTYSWSDGQSTQTASGLTAGNYTVTITDANGCTKTATATVTAAPGPVATATASATSLTLGGNSSLTATGGGTYQWNPTAGLSCATCSNPTATPTVTTEYCVVVTDASGCSDSACITIVVDIPCGSIYLPNAFSPNDDLENDLECVLGACVETIHLVIYNRYGEKVFESHDQKICWDGTYKDKRLDSAVFAYYLEATMVNGTKIFKEGNISLVR